MFLLGVAVLKKHYYNLLNGLPQDFMTTLEKLHKLIKVEEGVEDAVVSCGSSEKSNRKILDLLVLAMNDLLFFCDIMEAIVNPGMESVVHALRNGKMYVLLYL